MALPVGVTTCTYVAGPAGSMFGTPAKVSATIKPLFGGPSRLIYEPTGWVMPAFGEAVPEDNDGIVQFDLPHVNQAGFVDPAGNTVAMWAYLVTVRVAMTGGSREVVTYTQTLQPLVGEDNVDLDLVPDDGAATPITSTPRQFAFVNHGDNPNMARPDVVAVWWTGTVEPVNADTDYDLWTGPEGA